MVREQNPDFKFVCFTDDPVEGIECREPPAPYPGWWAKVGFFRPDLPIDGSFLYLDLDVLVTGNLKAICWGEFKIIQQTKTIRAPNTVCRYNSSAMYFHRPGIRRKVWDEFDPALMEKYRGDQDWIGDCIPNEQTIPRSWVKGVESCKNDGPPDDLVKIVLCNKIKNKEAARRFLWVREIWR